jgi:hypothetical protein
MFRFSVNQPYEIKDESSRISIEDILMQQRVIVLARIGHEEKFCKYI